MADTLGVMPLQPHKWSKYAQIQYQIVEFYKTISIKIKILAF